MQIVAVRPPVLVTAPWDLEPGTVGLVTERGRSRSRSAVDVAAGRRVTAPRDDDRWRGPGSPMTPVQALRLQREGGNAVVKEAFAIARSIVYKGGGIADFLDSLGADTFAIELRLRLMVGVRELEALEAQVNLALVLHEIERMKADIRAAEMAKDHAQGHPGFRGAERVIVLSQIAAGNSSDVELADVVFKMRHPDRATNPLDPSDPADRPLIKEWVQVRRGLVAQVMRTEVAKLLLTPAPGKG